MDMKYLPNLPLSVKGGQPGVGGVLKKREHLILLLYHFSGLDINKQSLWTWTLKIQPKYLFILKNNLSKLIYKTKKKSMYLPKWNIPLKTSYAYGSSWKRSRQGHLHSDTNDMISRNWILSIENNRQLTEFPSIFATSDYL